MNNLEKEIQKLRQRTRVLTLAVVGLFTAAIAGAGFQYSKPHNITLVSPNGKNKVILSATNDTAGIWLGRNFDDQSSPMVSLYSLKGQEAVIGVVGKNKYGLDAALSTTDQGGMIQVLRNENNRRMSYSPLLVDKVEAPDREIK